MHYLLLLLALSFNTLALESTKDFTKQEWMSKHCDETDHKMNPDVMRKVQLLRDYMNQPLQLMSAYRCAIHPVEAAKATPGQHYHGLAVDIYITDGAMAAKMIMFAIRELDVKGFAYSKKGKFIHLDWRKEVSMTWNY